MFKNNPNAKLMNTFIMCLFLFAVIFNSMHEIFDQFDIDTIEITDDLDKSKSDKEANEKVEFEDEFVKIVITHHFIGSTSKKQKFEKPNDGLRNGIKRILIPPPRNC